MKSLTIEEAKEYIGKQVVCWYDEFDETPEVSLTPMKLLYVCKRGSPFLCEDKDGDAELYKCIAPYKITRREKLREVLKDKPEHLALCEERFSDECLDKEFAIWEFIADPFPWDESPEGYWFWHSFYDFLTCQRQDCPPIPVKEDVDLPPTREEFDALKKRVERLERNEEIILG